MSKTILILIVFAGLSIGPQVFAQVKPTDDPQSKARKNKPETDRSFSEWLKEVGPILSESELEAAKKLTSSEEREKFIEIIWHSRDPDPDTEENEYREAYYERLAYVNEHFSSGIPGYKTDRGRIYLKYGKPDEVDSHPAGGPYERDLSEGGGSTSTYPFEKWFYRNIPGLSGAEIEFVDPTGTGQYRLANNPFEKDALLNVPGAAPTTSGISQVELNAAAHGFGNPFSSREADSPFRWLEQRAIIDSQPATPKNDPFADRLTSVNTVIDENPLGFEAALGFYKLDENRVVTTVTVQADNSELSFHSSGGVQVASANIVGRILNVAGR